MMIGHEMGKEFPELNRENASSQEKNEGRKVVLEVKNISNRMLHNISFTVRQGEIFGIAGLVGSGRTELVRAILGIDPILSGEVVVKGRKVRYKNFKEAMADGFGLIPEDRGRQGLILSMPIKQNVSLAALHKICLQTRIMSQKITQWISPILKQKETTAAEMYRDDLHIAAEDVSRRADTLSGGNQQKVVISRWLFEDAQILFMDEPTRGIDVGARSEIYHLIAGWIKEGKTIIMVSSEMTELLGMCSRIMVMHEGKKAGELNGNEATQEKIMALCV